MSTGEVLALKRVVKRTSEDTRFLDQAINEHEVGSQFKHPAIRKILDIHRVKRWMSLKEIRVIMEYVKGQSVQQNRPTDVIEAVRVFLEVAAALGHMNTKGFVHADTKPNNIIVSAEGTVKVIDFGQSCPIGTVKSRIQGTPDFIAPEQVHRRPLDAPHRRVQLRRDAVLDPRRQAHPHRPAQGGLADAQQRPAHLAGRPVQP